MQNRRTIYSCICTFIDRHNGGKILFTCAILNVQVYTDMVAIMDSKTCLKRPLKRRPRVGFQDRLSLTAGQKYCRMLQREHSAILSTCIKPTSIFKTFVVSIFEWPLKTGFTVCAVSCYAAYKKITMVNRIKIELSHFNLITDYIRLIIN